MRVADVFLRIEIDTIRQKSGIGHSASVSRFCKIPPLGQNFKTLRQLFEGLVSFGQIFTPLLQIFYTTWQIFIVLNELL